MGFRITGLCRGDGKGYVNVLVSESDGRRYVASAVASNGRRIPCAVYDMLLPGDDVTVAAAAGMYTGSERQLVIAVPLLDGTALQVDVYDTNDLTTPVWGFPFKPLETKIRSRLTYRRRPQFAATIRGIDQRRLSGQPYAYVTGIYPLGERDMVCRFHATVPYTEGMEYEATVLDAAANPIGGAPLLLEDDIVPDSRDRGNTLRELTYSVTLHRTDLTVCIAVRGRGQSAAEGCFTCLLPAQTESFLNAGIEGLKHASQDPRYLEWFIRHRATPADLLCQRELIATWKDRPTVSIVTPVYRPKAQYFRAMIESVLAQSYDRFELVLVNASGECPEVDAVLHDYADEARIRVITVENQGISGNTNIGIEQTSGDYIAFVDHDDTIEPDALYRYMSVVREHPQTDLLYCDEDHLKGDHYEWPTFKPAFNPDLLYSHNYITHMLMISRHVWQHVTPSTSEVDGAQDYDLTLKCSEVAREIHNVPHMLYHWREHEASTSSDFGAKPYTVEAGRKALQAHFDRVGIPAHVENHELACAYRVRYDYAPKVSIVIPTKDHADMLDTCIRSVVDRTEYADYEIICVENNSTEKSTFEYYERIQKEFPQVHVVTWPHHEFNYSAICNFGARYAKGELLLFLNNDTEVIAPEWLSAMAGMFARPDVGVAGAKLYNYDGLLQHGGIWAVPGGCFYINQNFTQYDNGYMNTLRFPSDCAAVTGACQMISRRVFDAIGGFDEDLAVSFSDIDLCLKAEQAGWNTVFCPEATLYHRESSSRGRDDLDPVKQRRMEREKFRFFDKWSALERGKFFNINLDQYDGHFKIMH